MKTREELRALRERAKADLAVRDSTVGARVVVAMGTCGIACGAREVMTSLLEELSVRGLTDITVAQTSCKGLCDKEPIVEVHTTVHPTVTYGKVSPDVMKRIVSEHIMDGHIVSEHAIAIGSEE